MRKQYFAYVVISDYSMSPTYFPGMELPAVRSKYATTHRACYVLVDDFNIHVRRLNQLTGKYECDNPLYSLQSIDVKDKSYSVILRVCSNTDPEDINI